MATVDEKQRNELIQKALESIRIEPSDQARQLCREIVETISSACEKNQKEIAEELHVLAKAVESNIGNQEAFEFKQKTCAIMLEISMEERRKAKIHGQEEQVPQNNQPNTNEADQSQEEKNNSSQQTPNQIEPTTVPQAPIPAQAPVPQAPAPQTPAPQAPAPQAPAPQAPAPQAPAPQAPVPQAPAPTLPAQAPPEAQPNQSAEPKSQGEPPRSKIIGLPSQTSVPAQPGSSSSSSSFFSSKMIGVATGSTPPPVAEPVVDTTSSTTDVETSDSLPGVEAAPQVPTEEILPFKKLAYLYIGSNDFDETVSYYMDVLKAEQVWAFDRFGSKVTAIRVSPGPLILISNHRKAPSCQPVFEVDDLSNSTRELKERGWKEQAGPFGTPNGEAYSFADPSGNSIAIFQVDPDSTDRSYVDPTEY